MKGLTLNKQLVLDKLKAILTIILVFTAQQCITASIIFTKNPPLAITLVVIGVLIYGAVVIVAKPFKMEYAKHWKSKAWIKNSVIVVGTYILMYISSGIVTIIKTIAHHTEVSANQDAINSMATNGSVILVVAMVLIAPFFEEVAFRWAIFDKLFKDYKWYIPFIVSSIVFAGMHVMAGSLFDIWNWLTYLPMAMIFSGLYAWRRNIVLNISVHLLWNLTSVAAMLAVLN